MSPANAEAGPSTLRPEPADTTLHEQDLIEIPSFGLGFFEYRRACFLAGQSPPIPPPSTAPNHCPTTYLVPPPPPPLPYEPKRPGANSSIGRLEVLLDRPGAEEDDEVWTSGVEGVWRKLDDRKRLAKPLRLGLIIKILRAGWLRDGTWPVDPRTSKAVVPPESPDVAPAPLPAIRPLWMQDGGDTAAPALAPEAQVTSNSNRDGGERPTAGKRQNRRGGSGPAGLRKTDHG